MQPLTKSNYVKHLKQKHLMQIENEKKWNRYTFEHVEDKKPGLNHL